MNSFADLGLLESLVNTLKTNKIFKPTEIQAKTIPMMMSGQAVVGVSETGSGKTLAYALPLLHTLKTLELEGQGISAERTPRALVIVPTRELGEQVAKVFKTLTHETRLRVRTVLGGMEADHIRRNIAGSFEILLATPGKLIQQIEKTAIDLSDIRYIIIDEADQMIDQGFLPDTKTIVDICSKEAPLSLFSATVSQEVQDLINSLFADAEVFRSSGSGKTVSTLETKNMIVKDGKRWPLMEKLLKQKTEGGTLVFTNTREQCDKLTAELTDKGFKCAIYRGDMDRSERRSNYKQFRDKKIDLLVATDLAGRGLDLDHVGRVINYHLPQQMENYLHRVGRTARAGKPGLVVNLVTERDQRLIDQLEGKKNTPAKSFAKRSGEKNRQAKTSAPKSSSKGRPSKEKSKSRKSK